MNSQLAKRFGLLGVFFFLAIRAEAETGDELFKSGLDAARAGQFPQAAKAFNDSLARQPAAGTLLNLGIVDWRCGRVGEAIVSWERAAWLNPFDADARNNLAFARQAAQLDPPELAWPEWLSTWLPARVWGWLACGSLWLALALVILPGVLRARKAGWQQTLAALACGVFILSLPPNLGVITRTNLGIVLEKDTVLRLTPTQEGEVVATLSAGEAARKLRERGGFFLIRTARGSGWVERRQFELLSPAR